MCPVHDLQRLLEDVRINFPEVNDIVSFVKVYQYVTFIYSKRCYQKYFFLQSQQGCSRIKEHYQDQLERPADFWVKQSGPDWKGTAWLTSGRPKLLWCTLFYGFAVSAAGLQMQFRLHENASIVFAFWMRWIAYILMKCYCNCFHCLIHTAHYMSHTIILLKQKLNVSKMLKHTLVKTKIL